MVRGADRHRARWRRWQDPPSTFLPVGLRSRGRERPLLVAVMGMSKAYRTTFTASDYAKVQELGEEYFASNPRSII